MSLLFSIVLVVLGIDRLSKIFFYEQLSRHSVIWIIKPWFNFLLVENRGAAFGLFQNSIPFLVLISIAVFFLILYFYRQEKNPPLFLTISYGLLLGGALGNLYDRIFLGYVVDFINLTFWPTFNAADICINLGVAGLIYYYFFQNKKAH